MSAAVAKNDEATGKQLGGVTGKGFLPGQSGNPTGRPMGLEKRAREAVGKDGDKLVTFWLDVMTDGEQDMRIRLEASKLLADRGWGRPAQALTGKDGGPIEVAHTDVSVAKERVSLSVDEVAERRALKTGTDA